MYEEGTKAMAMPGMLTQNFDGNGADGNFGPWAWILPFLLTGRYGLGRDGAAANFYNDANSATNQNVEALRTQVQQSTSAGQFEALSSQIAAFQAASQNGMNQSQIATNQQFQSLCNQIADCCCENRVATERINTSIALAAKDNQASMFQCCCDLKEQIAGVNTSVALQGKDVEKAICEQTFILERSMDDKNQAVLDLINNNTRSELERELADSRLALVISNQNQATDVKFQQVDAMLQQVLSKLNGSGC